jgi:hypothetical protein
MIDYIPRKDSELITWNANFIQRVVENAAAWDIPASGVKSKASLFRKHLSIPPKTVEK